MSPPTLTDEVLTALRRIGCPVTTPDLVRFLNDGRPAPLINDQVYRAATALRARGAVRSLQTATNKRVRYWEYVTDQPRNCSCSQDAP